MLIDARVKNRTHNPKVVGSNPVPATNLFNDLAAGYETCLFWLASDLNPAFTSFLFPDCFK